MTDDIAVAVTVFFTGVPLAVVVIVFQRGMFIWFRKKKTRKDGNKMMLRHHTRYYRLYMGYHFWTRVLCLHISTRVHTIFLQCIMP